MAMNARKQRKVKREGEAGLYGPTVNRPHHFFWNTKLSAERRVEINTWLASLSDDQRDMFNELLDDVRDEERNDCEYD